MARFSALHAREMKYTKWNQTRIDLELFTRRHKTGKDAKGEIILQVMRFRMDPSHFPNYQQISVKLKSLWVHSHSQPPVEWIICLFILAGWSGTNSYQDIHSADLPLIFTHLTRHLHHGFQSNLNNPSQTVSFVLSHCLSCLTYLF